MGKKAVVMLESYAEKYNIIPGREYLYDWKSPLEMNVFVALDCADVERLGSFRSYFDKAKTTICIDHHETNDGFAELNYIEADASSTAEMVFDVIEALSQKLPVSHTTDQNSDTAIVGADLVSARACANTSTKQKPDACTCYMLSGQTQGLPLQCTCCDLHVVGRPGRPLKTWTTQQCTRCDLHVVGAGSSRPSLPKQHNMSEPSAKDISCGREDPAPTVCRADDFDPPVIHDGTLLDQEIATYMHSGQTQGLPQQCTHCDLHTVGAGSSRPSLPKQHNISEPSAIDISSGREDPAPTVCRADDFELELPVVHDGTFLDQEIATCIYAGIIGDTGGFRYSSTSQRTMKIAAKLMSTGINFPHIYSEILHKHSFAASKAFGIALANCESAMDGRIVYTHLTREMLASVGADSSDMDNVVEYLMSTRGAEAALFFYERHQSGANTTPPPEATTPSEQKKIKVSMRSKGLHIGHVATHFGGGGHRMAAGCTIMGNIQDVMQDVLALIVRFVEGEV